MRIDKSLKIRTLIVDDEPVARQTIRLLLQRDAEIEIVGECGDGIKAVNSIRKELPNLVFLDIQMPEMNGFDVLKKIPAEDMPVIVFVTAFDQYAIRAFETGAIDYLLKPFDDKRFENALERAKDKVKNNDFAESSRRLLVLLQNFENQESDTRQNQLVSNDNFLQRLLIKSAGRTFLLETAEIDWIQAEDYYAHIHTGRKSYLLRQSLNYLEENLDPRNFVRIHRSTIVNIDRIKELHPHFNGDYVVFLKNGTELKMSRNRREKVEDRLKFGRR